VDNFIVCMEDNYVDSSSIFNDPLSSVEAKNAVNQLSSFLRMFS
jgi:hypothetical protein